MDSPSPVELAGQVLQSLADDAARLAAVRYHQLGRRAAFIDVTIERQRFKACIYGKSLIVREQGGAVCVLGAASIVPAWSVPDKWAIHCRDAAQGIALNLSEPGRRRLAVEFGLPIWTETAELELAIPSEADFFYASQAFEALVDWRLRHPQTLCGSGGDIYLGDWLARASEAALARLRRASAAA